MRETRESTQRMLIALLLTLNLIVACVTLYRAYPENPTSVFANMTSFEKQHSDTLNRLSTQINEVQALSEMQVQQIINEVRRQFDAKLIEYSTDPDAFERAVEKAKSR
jgi:ABC-type sugar transport system substrate-binding protein